MIDEEQGYNRSLLASNSGKFERAIEVGLQVPEELWEAAGRVGDIEIDLPDEALPFLVWELGLEPVLPYIRDLRRAISEGAEWQRIRGTPVSIELALGWIGEVATVDEMPEAYNYHYIQLSLASVPDHQGDLENHIALTRMSAPVHVNLARIYSGYDQRTLRVNRDRVNGSGLVNDWSGVWVRDDWPKLSFGLKMEFAADPPVAPQISLELELVYRGHHLRTFHVGRSRVNGPARVHFGTHVWSGDEIEFSYRQTEGAWGRWPVATLPKTGSWRDVGIDHLVTVYRVAEHVDERSNGSRWPLDAYPKSGSWSDIPRAGAIYDYETDNS